MMLKYFICFADPDQLFVVYDFSGKNVFTGYCSEFFSYYPHLFLSFVKHFFAGFWSDTGESCIYISLR